MSDTRREKRRRALVGICVAFGVAAAWVAASQFSVRMYSSGFNAPFFSVWLTTSLHLVLLPLYVLVARALKKTRVATLLRDAVADLLTPPFWPQDKDASLARQFAEVDSRAARRAIAKRETAAAAYGAASGPSEGERSVRGAKSTNTSLSTTRGGSHSSSTDAASARRSSEARKAVTERAALLGDPQRSSVQREGEDVAAMLNAAQRVPAIAGGVAVDGELLDGYPLQVSPRPQDVVARTTAGVSMSLPPLLRDATTISPSSPPAYTVPPHADFLSRLYTRWVGLSYPPPSAGERSAWHVARFVLPFACLWVSANYLYVRALGKMAATDVTAVFAVTPAFVYLLSLLLLERRFEVLRLSAVLLTAGGVVMVASASGLSAAGVEGVLCTLGASLAAALYKVLFKVALGDGGLGAVNLHLFFLAVLNLLLFWPVVVALLETGEETIVWATVPWGFVLGSAGLSLLFNLLVNVGVAVTYPLLVSLGTVLGIPLNAAVDSITGMGSFPPEKIAGCVLVTLGFVLLILPRPQGRSRCRELCFQSPTWRRI